MPLDIQRIRGLCFDVDGTLSDTDDLYVLKFERFFRPFQFILPQRDAHRAARRFVMWAETPGNSLIGFPDRLHLDEHLFGLAEWINKHRNRPLHDYLLIDGVHEMLTALQPHYPMTVVTARDDRSTRAFLNQFGLTDFFQEIITALTVVHTKPFPHPIRHAAEIMGIKPEECLMIGDTTVDIRAGKAAGAQTVGVLCGFGQKHQLQRTGADLILDTTADLTSILLPQ
jgi:N-acetyl-D-muramate 6-phosphate phosphatase